MEMGKTLLHIEENGQITTHKESNGHKIKELQEYSIKQFGKPNKIKYAAIDKRVLQYDERNIIIKYDDTVNVW